MNPELKNILDKKLSYLDIHGELEDNLLLFGEIPNYTSTEVVTAISYIEDYHFTNIPKPFTFYCWYDAAAGQLRTCMCNIGEELPFRCSINHLASKEEIATDVFSDISSLYLAGVLLVYKSKKE